MIQKAIEKIDEEIKNGGVHESVLGKYVKSELLTSDSNALKILAPNTDLETFMERINEVASIINGTLKHCDEPSDKKEIKNNEEFVSELNNLCWRIITLIKTGNEPKESEKAESENDENLFISKLLMKTYFANKGSKNNGVCLSSEIILPLLHIYYGIALEEKAEAAAPKRRRFNAVSLD